MYLTYKTLRNLTTVSVSFYENPTCLCELIKLYHGSVFAFSYGDSDRQRRHYLCVQLISHSNHTAVKIRIEMIQKSMANIFQKEIYISERNIYFRKKLYISERNIYLERSTCFRKKYRASLPL